MYRTVTSTVYIALATSVIAAYGEREGIVRVRLDRIRDENARGAVERALALGSVTLDASDAVVRAVREAIERGKGGR